MAGKVPVLMYHKVAVCPPGAKIPGHYVSPRLFRLQMKVLKKLGWQGLSVSEMMTGTGQGRPIALTFDDGYANFSEFALPILQEFDFTATVFVVTGLMGSDNRWDSSQGEVSEPLMTWEQANFCLEQGMEIGSHTVTHAKLAAVLSEEAREEIERSRDDIAEKTGHRPLSFCYPYGSYSPETAAMVKEAGYSCALTVKKGAFAPQCDPYQIPRVNVRSDTRPAVLLYKLIRCRTRSS